MGLDDSASGNGHMGSESEAEKGPASRENRANWHDGGSVHGGFMTGKNKGYGGDGGVEDASYSSRYSDKEHLPSFRTDVGAGSWLEAGYHLATTIATPAAYAPLAFAFASLTWAGGLIWLLLGIAVTWYCSLLLASLNGWDGNRYLRYRDLSYSIWGPFGFYATVFFQQVASIGNNITVQIAAAISAKSIYLLYKPDGNITLQEFIIMFGALQLILSQLPTIHSLRGVNVLCTICTLGFTITCVAMSIKDGTEADRSTVDYSLAGTPAAKVFNAMAALGIIAFTFGDTLLPEIQATVPNPVNPNMYKGISFCFSIITGTYLILAITGYWAFGNLVAPFIVQSFTTPTWGSTIANAFLIIQVVGCYQIYCRPTYEFVEVRFMDMNKPPMALRNVISRLIITTIYISLVTLIAAMIPFFGNFAALVGAIGFTPLDFILPALLYLTAKRPRAWVWVLNITITVVYTCVAVVGAVGAFKLIIEQADTYSVFANL